MIGVFYASNRIPTTLLCLLLWRSSKIDYSKRNGSTYLVYEAGAIAIIALACLIVRFNHIQMSEKMNNG